jgi:hypothetical protein
MAWAPDYITVDELKDYVRVGDDVDDVQLAVAISAASRSIDSHCNRQFGRVATAQERTYTARPDYRRGVWVVDVDDLDDSTGLTLASAGDAITAYTLEPVNAVANGLAWTRIIVSRDSAVQPTGAANEMTASVRWGWTATPPAVVLASYLQSSRFSNRRDSPYGVAGSPQTGSELRLLARLDPDVAVSLRKYVRPRRVA